MKKFLMPSFFFQPRHLRSRSPVCSSSGLIRLSILIFTLLCAVLTPTFAATTGNNAGDIGSSIEQQEQARQDLNRRIKEYNDLEQKKARESQTILGRLSKLKQDAQSTRDRITQLEGENTRLEKLMKDIDANITSVTQVMATLTEDLQDRIMDMYKFSSREDLHILLSTDSTHEALVTAWMLDRIAREESELVDTLTARMDDLKGLRLTLAASQEQVRVQTDELQKKRAEFDTTVKQTNALLNNVRSQQKQAHDAAAELEAAEREIGNRIVALVAQREKQRAAQAAPVAAPVTPSISAQPKQQSQPVQPSQPVKAPVKPQPSQPVKAPVQQQTPVKQNYAWLTPGTPLEWPVRGKVTTQFGSRVHPEFKTKVFNSGIDIKAAAGTPVTAAGPGEVLFTGWLRGLGQVVIVNHGSDLATVYAHLASASVREGDAVRTGSTLGTVGNSGTSSDYELHFEVRKSGAAQNPISYLKRA